jgi:hypothetical protein
MLPSKCQNRAQLLPPVSNHVTERVPESSAAIEYIIIKYFLNPLSHKLTQKDLKECHLYYYTMENMPRNIINKIYFFTSHPAVEILRGADIFKALAQLNQEILAEPFLQGLNDSWSGEGYDPRKWENKEDIDLYNIGYEHHYDCTQKDLFERDCQFHCPLHLEKRERR